MPAVDDLKHMIDRAWNSETRGVAFERLPGHARWVAIHSAQRGRLDERWKRRDKSGEPVARTRPVESDELASEIAERICGSEEDESADPLGMSRGQHHRNCSAVGVAG